jgi:hypothetical protein
MDAAADPAHPRGVSRDGKLVEALSRIRRIDETSATEGHLAETRHWDRRICKTTSSQFRKIPRAPPCAALKVVWPDI